MESSGTMTKETLLFFAAAVFLIAEAAMLSASGSGVFEAGSLRTSDIVPSVVVADIGRKEDIKAYLAGARENPFAEPGGVHSDITLVDVAPAHPIKPPPHKSIAPPPLPKPKKPPTAPKNTPKPPTPPPAPPTAPKNDPPKQPKAYELPVMLVGVLSVDGVRRVILKIKDNQYYLTLKPGEKVDALGIEVVSVDGEEVTLRSMKTDETFLLQDLAKRLRNTPAAETAGEGTVETAGEE